MPSADLLDYAEQAIDTLELLHVYADDVVRYLRAGEYVTPNATGAYILADENMEFLLGCVADEIKDKGKKGMGIRDAGLYILKTRRELGLAANPVEVFEILKKRGLIEDDLQNQKTVFVHADVVRSYW